MKTFSLAVAACIALLFISCSRERSIDILATTDVHGMLLPYDFTDGKTTSQSMANISYLRDSIGKDRTVLLDNGDILQGDPLVYYFNFVDTTTTHIVPRILNDLGYDAATTGNHDIETGHRVYDRVVRQADYDVLAANAIDEKTGKPYFKPYVVINRNGLKIVVFGMITPAVPDWIPASLYEGIRFDNMVETAKKWMPELKRQNPDFIVGLFHSGLGDKEDDDENSAVAVAVNVPGFDVVFAGHDHAVAGKKVADINGDSVLVLDGGSRSSFIMHATVKINADGSRSVTGENVRSSEIGENKAFAEKYNGVADTLRSYTERVIGFSTKSADTRESFFGPSAFVDLIHTIQLSVSGADISFAAPLSFYSSIDSGVLRMSDMFKLYRFENFLYTINMTGAEIDKYLEFSYGKWMNTMSGPADYMLRYKFDDNKTPVLVNGMLRLQYPSYNFDSADGLVYTVDLRKEEGQRVSVTGLADGRVFSPDSVYHVAVNSYRANGGGGHLRAAGITHEMLPDRLVSATPYDFRYYMTSWIEKEDTITPTTVAQWKTIPEAWIRAAKTREMVLLFGDKK